MELEKAINNRQSVRKYLKNDVAVNDIEEILQAGIRAPSGLNNQPWKFLVLKESRKDGLARFTRYGEIIRQAPRVICVFLDASVSYDREKDIMAIGACIQNMLLKAFSLNYGTCWLGEILNQRKQAHAYLKLSRELELLAVIALGRSADAGPLTFRKQLNDFLIDDYLDRSS